MRAIAIGGMIVIGSAMLGLFVYLMLDSSNIDRDKWPEEEESDE